MLSQGKKVHKIESNFGIAMDCIYLYTTSVPQGVEPLLLLLGGGFVWGLEIRWQKKKSARMGRDIFPPFQSEGG